MPARYEIDRRETLRYLGWRGQELSPELSRRLDELSALCRKAAEPRGTWRRFSFEPTGAGVRLAGTEVTLMGRDLAAHLAGASELVLLAVTLGHGVDRVLARLQSTSMTDAVIFNAAATALTEAAADAFQRELQLSLNGLYVNGRYSPGYGDFPIGQQHELLGLLSAGEALGITLTEGSLMLPRKSVTAVLGLFSEEKGVEAGCAVCGLREFCEYRETGEHCG